MNGKNCYWRRVSIAYVRWTFWGFGLVSYIKRYMRRDNTEILQFLKKISEEKFA